MSDAELVVVRTFLNKFQADVAKTALDAAGIESFIRSDDGGGQRPGMWVGTGVELVVRADDAPEATEILDAPAPPDSGA